jgi:HAMP domain-containing protein
MSKRDKAEEVVEKVRVRLDGDFDEIYLGDYAEEPKKRKRGEIVELDASFAEQLINFKRAVRVAE